MGSTANITIEAGQQARKAGMYLVTNRQITKVILLTECHDKAIAASSGNKLWYPLTKADWTTEDTVKAMQELSLGLQCNIGGLIK